jgi:hypothetical protein
MVSQGGRYCFPSTIFGPSSSFNIATIPTATVNAFTKAWTVPSTPPLLRVLLSAHSQIRCFPNGSCQFILVSRVHFASFRGSGVLERILDPLVGLEDEDIMNDRRERGCGPTKEMRNVERRRNGSDDLAMIFRDGKYGNTALRMTILSQIYSCIPLI